MCLQLDRCTPNSSMLATAEASMHSPSLAEAGEGNHLPGLGELEVTSLSLVESLYRKQTKTILFNGFNLKTFIQSYLLKNKYLSCFWCINDGNHSVVCKGPKYFKP